MVDEKVIDILKQGGVIAYPTEAVYGLGCDPFNEAAVEKILAIKARPRHKGVILIAASVSQIVPLIDVSEGCLAKAQATWPGPVTWLFPAAKTVPEWIRGEHASVALRVTDHPIAKAICQQFGGPIVSTSANLSGEVPLREYAEVEKLFASKVDFVVPGAVGDLDKPTVIRDVQTGSVVRC